MVLWSPLRCTLTTPEVSTTNAETGHPLASQASIAVVAASRARASGSEYPDRATCAAAKDERVIEAHALKLSAATTDFIMLTSLADGFDWCPGGNGRMPPFLNANSARLNLWGIAGGKLTNATSQE